MKHPSPTADLPAFIADCTLGRLAKWLRLAGLDTRWDSTIPDFIRLERISVMDHRAVLTRTKSVFQKIGPPRCRFIQSNDVMDQVREVINDFNLQRDHLRILTICANCNFSLSQIHRNDIRGRVPDFILQQYETLMTCAKCRRIYWPGTHALRINSIIDGWFTRSTGDDSLEFIP
jgi:uncharacterized protein